MSGQSATCLRRYMFQVNLIFSYFLSTKLDQLYDLTGSHKIKKKKKISLKIRIFQGLTQAQPLYPLNKKMHYFVAFSFNDVYKYCEVRLFKKVCMCIFFNRHAGYKRKKEEFPDAVGDRHRSKQSRQCGCNFQYINQTYYLHKQTVSLTFSWSLSVLLSRTQGLSSQT